MHCLRVWALSVGSSPVCRNSTTVGQIYSRFSFLFWQKFFFIYNFVNKIKSQTDAAVLEQDLSQMIVAASGQWPV